MDNRLLISKLSFSKPHPVLTAVYFLGLLALWSMLGPIFVFPYPAMLLCVYVLCAGVSAGPIAGALCAVLSVGYAFYLGGAPGALCLCLCLVPALFVGAYCLLKPLPFPLSVALCFGALLLGGLLALCAALALCGGDLSTVLSERLHALLLQSPQTDTLLTYGYVSGLLPLSGDIKIPALAAPSGVTMPGAPTLFGSSILLNPQAREELLRSLLLTFRVVFCRDVPGQLLCGSLLGGVLLQALPRRALRRKGEGIELPPLRTWHVPSGYGRLIVLPALVTGVWFTFSPAGEAGGFTYTSGAYIAFSALYGAMNLIFALQGLAVLDFMLHRSGKGRSMRTVVAVAAFVLLGSIASLAGLLDQSFDFRHLRKPPENFDDKQEDDF